MISLFSNRTSAALVTCSFIVSLSGCRGTDDSKKAAALKDVKLAPPGAAKSPPATFAVRDLTKVIDVGSLPVIDGSDVREQNAVLFDAEAPGKLADVLEQYVKALTALGWKRFEPEGSTPVKDEFGSVQFAKNGHVVKVEVGKSSPDPKTGDPRTAVTVRFHGDLDSRQLPRPAGATPQLSSQIMSAHHSDNSVADEAAWILKALKAEGWQEYSRLGAGAVPAKESPDFASFLVRKRGYAVGVLLAKLPTGKKTAVTYTVEALAHELPAPPDATKVEFDDAAAKVRAEVPGDWKAAAEFYRKAMPAAGYVPIPGEDPQPTYQNLRFSTDARDIVMVQVSSKDGKTTAIFMEVIPAAVVALQLKAIEKANRPPEIAPLPPKAIVANEVPLPGEVKDVKYDAAREEIAFRSAAEIAPLVAQIRGRLTAAGWVEEMGITVLDKRVAMLTFRMGPATLAFNLVNEGGGTQATISATGIAWTKTP